MYASVGIPNSSWGWTSIITRTGFLVYFLNTSLISKSAVLILGPVLYQPTIFSLAAAKSVRMPAVNYCGELEHTIHFLEHRVHILKIVVI